MLPHADDADVFGDDLALFTSRPVALLPALESIGDEAVADDPAAAMRQQVWSGSLPLWRDTAIKNPASSTAAAGLAEALLEAGRATEAEPWIRRAIALEGRPTGDRLVTLALVLDAQGRAAEAGAAAAQAIEADPRFADPPARVAVLAMERPVAAAFADLLRRSAAAGRAPGKTAPAGPRFPAKPYFEP